MKWCRECKEVLEDDEVSIASEHYEAWGREFYVNEPICPNCGTYLEEYEGQDEEEEMDEVRELVDELSDKICNKFCRYSGTGKDGKCEYCQNHNNECPLDDLMRKVGLI